MQNSDRTGMRKVIAAINITVDGFCDHTAGIPDEEIHNHYTELLQKAGAMLYGRTTYQLMESFWPDLVRQPSGKKSMDDFALAIQHVPKVVFSHTLKALTWENSILAKRTPEEEVLALRQQPGKDIYVGSPGLIAALHQLGLIDEYQLCVHPVVIGKGLALFKNVTDRTVLKLLKTKTFSAGAVILYYERIK